MKIVVKYFHNRLVGQPICWPVYRMHCLFTYKNALLCGLDSACLHPHAETGGVCADWLMQRGAVWGSRSAQQQRVCWRRGRRVHGGVSVWGGKGKLWLCCRQAAELEFFFFLDVGNGLAACWGSLAPVGGWASGAWAAGLNFLQPSTWDLSSPHIA